MGNIQNNILPLPILQENECVLGADLFTDRLEILSAGVGFEGIIGVPQVEEDVIEAGGAWDSELDVCPLSGEEVPTNIRTSAAPPAIIIFFNCQSVPDRIDGFPICFSWPVLPSSINREHFLYTRSDGREFHPDCISSAPNYEFNERHCIVVFDDFINRKYPNETGSLFMERIDIVGDLMFVGPNGVLQSGKGLYRVADENESPYLVGPRFIGSRLSPLDDLGEQSSSSLNGFNSNIWPNSGLSLFGEAHPQDQLYRLRLFYSGGMTPDGVRNTQPTMFDDYFIVQFSGGEEISEANQPTIVTNTDGTNANITVLGIADVGKNQDAYDACYVEDRDNYFDIILFLESGDAEALKSVSSVLAFSKGKSLFNPGGPGNTPTLGVRYTAPGPANQQIAVRVDLENIAQTTYCVSWLFDRVTTDPDVCNRWREQGLLKVVPLGTPLPLQLWFFLTLFTEQLVPSPVWNVIEQVWNFLLDFTGLN